MKHFLKLELRRAFCNPLFLLALAGGVAISLWNFADQVWVWRNWEAYPTEYPLSVFHKCLIGQSGTSQPMLYYLLAPILCAVPYGNSYYFDLRSGYINQIVTRGRQPQYLAAKMMTSFLNGAVIAVVPLILDFLITGCIYPAIAPQSGIGFYSVGAADVLGDLFYIHPYGYTFLYLLLDAVFFGLMNLISFWAVDFVENRFWIMLMPFLVYMFLFCILQFVNKLAYAPFFFLRPSQPFRTYGGVILLEIGVLLIGSVVFLLRHRRREVL